MRGKVMEVFTQEEKKRGCCLLEVTKRNFVSLFDVTKKELHKLLNNETIKIVFEHGGEAEFTLIEIKDNDIYIIKEVNV